MKKHLFIFTLALLSSSQIMCMGYADKEYQKKPMQEKIKLHRKDTQTRINNLKLLYNKCGYNGQQVVNSLIGVHTDCPGNAPFLQGAFDDLARCFDSNNPNPPSLEKILNGYATIQMKLTMNSMLEYAKREDLAMPKEQNNNQ